jgi:NADH-quinone oxidoreductase subunit N
MVYVFSTLGTFGMILLLSRKGFEAENIEDFKGLNQRSRWYAGVMLFLMFSLAGVPPFIGFWTKLGVLQAVVGTGQFGLAIFAVLMSLVGAFYYLRIVKVMYFDEPTDTTPIQATFDVRAVLSFNGIAVLLLGIMPNALMIVAAESIVKTLAF